MSTIKWTSTQSLEQSINQHKESIKSHRQVMGIIGVWLYFCTLTPGERGLSTTKDGHLRSNPSPNQGGSASTCHVFEDPYCKDLVPSSSPVGLIHVLTWFAVLSCLQPMSPLMPTTVECCFLWTRPQISHILAWPRAAPAALRPCRGSHHHPALHWAKGQGQGGRWLWVQRMGSSCFTHGRPQALQLTSWGWRRQLMGPPCSNVPWSAPNST